MSYKRVYAEINLDAVEENFRNMKACLKPGTKMTAVIKTDGYGHGAVPIAQLVENYEYIWGFAVATVEEAVELRENGIRKPILILGYVFPEDYPILVRGEIRTAVFQTQMAEELAAEAKRQGKQALIHLALDTGMTRIGFQDSEQSVREICRIAALDGLQIEGMFTHFARADEYDKTAAYRQLDRYLKFADQLESAGVSVPIRHCSNSAGIMELPEANLNMVRAGITIYGIYPSNEVDREKLPLKPVMELKSHVSHVKLVPEGTEVSYGGTYVTTKETVIATIPVGYGDGYPRGLSSKGEVLIHGVRVPIIGRVCMDQFMVDATGLNVKPHDEVTLIGKDHDEEITIDEVTERSGRFPYEFVCLVGKRVPRVYRLHGSLQ